ncbi:MAG: sensor histidine kinase [Methylotenera sp.]|nr:sensor histidine kinase [Methylotenera sp.]
MRNLFNRCKALYLRRLAKNDFILAMFVTLFVYFSAVLANWAEGIGVFIQRHEFFQFDELLLGLFTAACMACWYSYRRVLDWKCELKQRQSAEVAVLNMLHENRTLTQHLHTAQEDERKRIAHEMHDEMGQYLTAIHLSAHVLVSQDNALTLPYAQRIMQHVAHIQNAIKHLLENLHATTLEEHHLADAVECLCNSWQIDHPNLECHFMISPFALSHIHWVDSTLKIAAYRMIQEALTNVAKHANATQVSINMDISKQTPHLSLSVLDNGMGMDLSQPSAGFGLLGVRERVRALHGNLKLSSSPQKGLQIDISLPIKVSD